MGSGRGRGRKVDVLLAEPDADDAERFAAAFDEVTTSASIHVVEDGEEVLDAVKRRGDFADGPRPDLVLLDLDHLETGGERVLSAVKGDPESRRIPVIAMTSSGGGDGVTRPYELHANAHVRKPSEPDEFVAFARSFGGFWVDLVHLPSEGS